MIEILLPVYNGEKYLREQIDSILNQSHKDWILKIRNDGSKDNSQHIIEEYCKRFPQKIIQIPFPKENIGLIKSLNILLASPPFGQYIMFADQDDVWFSNKIEENYQSIKQLETIHPDKPLGVCSDVECVDENLNQLSPSFFISQKFPSNIIGDINKMMALNIIQGCTLMTNTLAREKYFPLPDFLNVHDAWVGIMTSYYGFLKYIHKPLIAYRQHSNNALGEISINSRYYLSRAKSFISTISLIQKIRKALPFNTNLMSILYYKLFFAFKRIK